MRSVFVTGSNSGIGLEFVIQYAESGYTVYAAYFPQASIDDLRIAEKKYSSIKLIPMDVTQENQIEHVATQLNNTPIDILINNAGICATNDTLESVTIPIMEKTFMINTVGPLLVTRALMNNILCSELKTVVSISSILGSIGYNLAEPQYSAQVYAYSASKAALNMIMSLLAIDFVSRDLKILLLHPGHVGTYIGNLFAGNTITCQTSVKELIALISRIEPSISRFFFTREGDILPW